MTRVVGELAAGKTAVDAALFEGKTPKLGTTTTTTEEDIGLTTAGGTARSNLVSAVTLEDGAFATGEGSIKAVLGTRANKDIAGAEIKQIRNDQGVWSCEVKAASAPGFKDKFIPTGCTKG